MRVNISRRAWVSGLGVLGLLVASSGVAQTFYKWTDDRGVVHFSDSPPSDGKGVEERMVNAPPIVRRPAEAAADADPASGTDAVAAGTPTEAVPSGPARVIILSQKTPRISPSSVRVMGRVRNSGGEPVSNVTVEVTVVDETQGTVCMQEQADVDPGELAPGKGGTFDLTLDSPCLFGTANINLEPQWQ
ncbi:DUF4124 domain-containing protein [Candidatus Binatia bacterium]|nr:DUF4124 domain-containing protein [Candidatus Binatia bacterium]